MSLKGFHIVFITFSIMLALGVAAWCVQLYFVESVGTYAIGAGASFACAVAMFVYGLWFYRKMKRLRLIT